MIKFNCNECNIINLMIIVEMLKMNCMINGLIIWQMHFKTYMLRNMWIRLNHQCKHFKNLNNIYNNLNTNEFGFTLYGIVNCLLFDYTTTSNGNEMYIGLKCYIEHDAPTYVKYVFFNHQLIWKHYCLNIHFIYNYCLFIYWITYTKRGFSTSEIIDSSLLNSPLLTWDGI